MEKKDENVNINGVNIERVESHSSNHQTHSFVILAKQGKPILAMEFL